MSTASPDLAQICERIQSQIEHVLASTAYQTWLGSQRLKSGDFVVLNNSFLFRPGVTTTIKNAAYLAIQVADDGQSTLSASVTRPGTKLNAPFKRIPAAAAHDLTAQPLEIAVGEQLADLGTIVFSLVGAVGPDQPAVLPLGDRVPGLTSLRYAPGQIERTELDGAELVINRLDDVDVVWKAAERTISESGICDVTILADRFLDLLVKLRDAAGRPIDIHDVRPNASSILSNVVGRLADQVGAYKRALAEHVARADDSEALNETLRIAYNFADGAVSLLSLVIGLSDLKPIILWLTYGVQSDLSTRFDELPFALAGKGKASLDTYRSAIAGARNMAFHDVFAFGRPFSVPLEGDAIRGAELRLFREYSKRHDPALDYSDRKVVELLEGLTRVAERPVPIGFWDSNVKVMEAVCAVAKSVQSALMECAAATTPA
jgi:hypothetical protein